MSKEAEARKGLLETQIQHATVEEMEEPGFYQVFVPGCMIREYNYIQADNEEHAVERVREFLSAKIDQLAEQAVAQGGEVSVSPDKLKVVMKAKVKTVEGEDNG